MAQERDSLAFRVACGDRRTGHDLGGAPASCERYGYTDPAWRRDLSGSTFEFVLGRRRAPRRSAELSLITAVLVIVIALAWAYVW
jgi:hypothetical protein